LVGQVNTGKTLYEDIRLKIEEERSKCRWRIGERIATAGRFYRWLT
jgi:hypothetical protein